MPQTGSAGADQRQTSGTESSTLKAIAAASGARAEPLRCASCAAASAATKSAGNTGATMAITRPRLTRIRMAAQRAVSGFAVPCAGSDSHHTRQRCSAADCSRPVMPSSMTAPW